MALDGIDEFERTILEDGNRGLAMNKPDPAIHRPRKPKEGEE